MKKTTQKEFLKKLSGYQVQIITDSNRLVYDAVELFERLLLQISQKQKVKNISYYKK